MWKPASRCLAAAAVIACLGSAPTLALARPADTLASSYYRIIINVPAKTLEVYADGQLIRHCPCAVGRPWTPSPYGVYYIMNKTVNPTWYNPAGSVVPPGPSNPLGPRWLGVSKPGYGIHGTNVEASVGTAASHGCVRLSREDILWLYDAVPLGTRVQYVYRPAVVSGDPLTGFAMIEVAPDLYAHGVLTPAHLQQLAAAWGSALSEEACQSLIDATARGAHVTTDLGAAFICGGRRYPVKPVLSDRTLLLPIAPAAQALADAGAPVNPADIESDDAVSADRLAARLGVPLAISPSGPQEALLSPVIVHLDGRLLAIPGVLCDGEPYLHMATLTAFLPPTPAVPIAPEAAGDVAPAALPRPVEQPASLTGEYISWRAIQPLLGADLVVRQSGPYVSIFRDCR